MARTVLDSQLQLLDAQLLVMASSTEDALRASIAALAARDAEAANAVIDGDDDIDHQEREVEGLCVKLLLTQQPVATDLHRVSAALKIAGETRTVDAHVQTLRKKLSEACSEAATYIETVRGVGYRLKA